MADLKADIVVLGAGMVGVGAALHLQKRGRDVILVDRQELAGEGTSFGNAGLISPDTAVPIALPGMLPKVPRWLMDPLGPLSVRPSYFPRALPWLLRWVESGRLHRVLAISDAMRALHREAMDCWRELLGPELYRELFRPSGQVHVWEGGGDSSGLCLRSR